MPSAWSLHVIEERLRTDGIRAGVAECDVYSLPADQRTTVIDVLIAEQTSFPMVLVGGRVVSHNGIDLDSIVRAAREAAADDNCCC